MPAPADQLSPVLRWALTGLRADEPAPSPPSLTPLDTHVLRSTIGPLLLLTTTPLLVVLIWQVVVYHQGSVLTFLSEADPATILARVPIPSGTAWAIIAGWITLQLALLLGLPGPSFLGPVTPAGVQPAYRLNGVAAWTVTHVGLAVGWQLGFVQPAAVTERMGELLVALTVSALVFCAFLYVKGRRWPTTPDAVWTGNLLFDFFQGIELHPRLLGVNLKQLINCRVSMMGWSALVLLYAAARYDQGHLPASLAVCALLTTAYLFKFFWWEGGYFHSIDIMHDRFGYYICWGVLAWVPSVYCLPAFWMAHYGPDLSLPVATAITAIGLLALWINYDADAQRQRVRATAGQTTVWGQPPRLITARYTTADGEQRSNLLLANGWWGVARHFHYVPELTLAAAWTSGAGFTHVLPWFYFIFLFILLVDRAGRDEKRCAAKYGPDWDQYRAAVRWHMAPGVW